MAGMFLAMGNTFGINWGNATGYLKNGTTFSMKNCFPTRHLSSVIFHIKLISTLAACQGNIISRIQDYNVKEDFQYYASTKNEIKFGFNSIYHLIIPGDITIASNTPYRETWSSQQIRMGECRVYFR